MLFSLTNYKGERIKDLLEMQEKINRLTCVTRFAYPHSFYFH